MTRLSLHRARTVALAGAMMLAAPWLPLEASAGEEPFAPFMSPAREAEAGRNEHPKILARFGGVYDESGIGGYVASIGGSLVANTEQASYPFIFTVLNSPVVNAFALPGGYVYVTRGLLALANSEAELAGVLAHEIGHVTARHPAQRYSRNVIASIGAMILGVFTSNQQVNQLAQLGGELYLGSYSRDQEYEADLLGVRYLGATGYNPWAQAQFLKSLDAQHELGRTLSGEEEGRFDLDFFATHPRTAERVRRAIEAAAATGQSSTAPLRREEYLRQIDGLLYGDDPEQGFVRGRKFVHPKLRFAFTVPRDFRMFNDSSAVVARDSRGAIIRFDGEEARRGMDMVRYLTQVWARGLRLRDVGSLNVNGFEAATGAARVDAGGGLMDMRFVAIRFSRAQIYRFLFATPPQLTTDYTRSFQRTTFSFRRVNRAEAARLKPLRLRLARVRRGQKIVTLASHMAFGDHRVERFRVLNGLEHDQRLKRGQVVKLVQE